MKIKPVNNHLLIEPLVHEQFIATERETFQEIGVVIDFDPAINDGVSYRVLSSTEMEKCESIHKGDKVYFDSWLAAKFPKGDDSFYWLVEWQNVRAVEYAEPAIPE